MKFGEKLREARLKKGLSQAKLAEMTGVAKRTLINYENNGILPKQKDTYFILAKALEIDANVLMDDNAEFVTQAAEVYPHVAEPSRLSISFRRSQGCMRAASLRKRIWTR